jgi:hypothetical protein
MYKINHFRSIRGSWNLVEVFYQEDPWLEFLPLRIIPLSASIGNHFVFPVVHEASPINTIAKQPTSKFHEMLLTGCYLNALIRNVSTLDDAFDIATVSSS